MDILVKLYAPAACFTFFEQTPGILHEIFHSPTSLPFECLPIFFEYSYSKNNISLVFVFLPVMAGFLFFFPRKSLPLLTHSIEKRVFFPGTEKKELFS